MAHKDLSLVIRDFCDKYLGKAARPPFSDIQNELIGKPDAVIGKLFLKSVEA